ncbi:MAG: hypothetical protein DCC68_07575 [Planctomycetota bacterium]|nr:MAG: hypothetical protein DCC68_07575 [Planctomycetota bacterium]
MAEIGRRGIELYLDGERLRFRAPAGALGSELRAAVGEQRAAIIGRLQQPREVSASTTKCMRCDHRDWVDEPPAGGQIRTHCGKCGRFIGYRPVGT